MENAKTCQSCNMPLTQEMCGTEKDGAPSPDYCKYCYENGAFTTDVTMEGMIDECLGIIRGEMEREFPNLKRWKKA